MGRGMNEAVLTEDLLLVDGFGSILITTVGIVGPGDVAERRGQILGPLRKDILYTTRHRWPLLRRRLPLILSRGKL